MSSDIVLHYLAALAYLGLSVSIWKALLQHKNLQKNTPFISIGIFTILILQGVAIHLGMLAGDTIRINWALGLSFTVWLGTIIYWFENHFIKTNGFLLLLLPINTAICLLSALFPTTLHGTTLLANSQIFMVHLVISLFAYSIMALAALQAIISTGLDNYLHRPHSFNQIPNVLTRILDAQPPLLVQERLLFRLIWVGFILLSVSIISGIFVSLSMNGEILPNDHKTFFTLISWLIFGVLLFGRFMWGWRGRIALRWTLLGFALLMLAYTGTRFIFEELIHQGVS